MDGNPEGSLARFDPGSLTWAFLSHSSLPSLFFADATPADNLVPLLPFTRSVPGFNPGLYLLLWSPTFPAPLAIIDASRSSSSTITGKAGGDEESIASTWELASSGSLTLLVLILVFELFDSATEFTEILAGKSCKGYLFTFTRAFEAEDLDGDSCSDSCFDTAMGYEVADVDVSTDVGIATSFLVLLTDEVCFPNPESPVKAPVFFDIVEGKWVDPSSSSSSTITGNNGGEAEEFSDTTQLLLMALTPFVNSLFSKCPSVFPKLEVIGELLVYEGKG